MNVNEMAKKRAERMLFLDKLNNPTFFLETIKLEIYGTLGQFMQISPDDIKLNMTLMPSREYKLEFSVTTKTIKNVGISSNIK